MSDFKVGDKVRCINSGGYPRIPVGAVYTIASIDGEFLRLIYEGVHIGGYSYTRFELVRDHVLTPEDVLTHLLAGTKMEYKLDSKWVSHSGDLKLTSVGSLSSLQWRVKPVPEIIEANGRKYKLIEE